MESTLFSTTSNSNNNNNNDSNNSTIDSTNTAGNISSVNNSDAMKRFSMKPTLNSTVNNNNLINQSNTNRYNRQKSTVVEDGSNFNFNSSSKHSDTGRSYEDEYDDILSSSSSSPASDYSLSYVVLSTGVS